MTRFPSVTPRRAPYLFVLSVTFITLVAGCGSSDDHKKTASPKNDQGKITVDAAGQTTTTFEISGHERQDTFDGSIVPYIAINGVKLGMTRAEVESQWTPAASKTTQDSNDGGPPTIRYNFGRREVVIDAATHKTIQIETASQNDYLPGPGRGLHVYSTLAEVRKGEPGADCTDVINRSGLCRLGTKNGVVTDLFVDKGYVSRITIGYLRD